MVGTLRFAHPTRLRQSRPQLTQLVIGYLPGMQHKNA
jgi:hypothetical protein